jgi:hypothetical protein
VSEAHHHIVARTLGPFGCQVRWKNFFIHEPTDSKRTRCAIHAFGHAGIVKLSDAGPRKAIFLRDELGRSARLGDLAPGPKGSLARRTGEVGRDGFGTRDVEEVRDLIVNRQKSLCLPRRLNRFMISSRRLVGW